MSGAGKELLRRKKRGEVLTSVEWAQLARFHADRGVRWAYLSLALASLAFLFNLAMVVLR